MLEHPLGLAAWPRPRPTSSTSSGSRSRKSIQCSCAAPHSCSPPTTCCPRRTATKTGLWRRAFGRFERIVVHSERGRETLAAFGVPEEKLRVIPHPVTPGDPGAPATAGRCRARARAAHKQLEHAREAAARADAELRVAGDANAFLSETEIDRALGESTVAVFPYLPELDQSGALLRALGAGVPAVVYDVGGLAEPVRSFGAGRVVAPDDIEALAAAIRELIDDDSALAAARAGALSAPGADVGRRRPGAPRPLQRAHVSRPASTSAARRVPRRGGA